MRYRNQVADFEVEDTGIGIRAGDLERIFEPFERARSSAGANAAGTGLGLTITRLLAEIMGGEITVRSEPGKGSVFQVKLLLSEVPRPRTAPPIEHRVRGYEGPRQTILVVDDDQVHRDLVRELLEPLGFNVFAAANGAACLSLVNECRPEPDPAGCFDAGHGRMDRRAAAAPIDAGAPGDHHAFGDHDGKGTRIRARSRL